MTDERVLIIDDDERLGAMLVEFFATQGMGAVHRADARSGLAALDEESVDVVVLDVMLPDVDGFDVLRKLRGGGCRLPVIMLTARGDEMDRVVGLELGADDYVSKPFSPRELTARVRAVLRRVRPPPSESASTVMRFGDLEIDLAAQQVRKAGAAQRLTSHQFALLRVLAQRAGRVQTREQLMEAVRGEAIEAFDRSIDVHISRIRHAIEDDPKSPQRIRSVRGVGYVLVPGEGDTGPS